MKDPTPTQTEVLKAYWEIEQKAQEAGLEFTTKNLAKAMKRNHMTVLTHVWHLTTLGYIKPGNNGITAKGRKYLNTQ